MQQNYKPTTKVDMKTKSKDRLGQAVVSLIFAIFGFLFFIVSIFIMIFNSHTSDTSTVFTVISLFLAFILNFIGLILGSRAIRSSRGRGIAIAGTILTSIFLFITIIFIGGAGLIYYYILW